MIKQLLLVAALAGSAAVATGVAATPVATVRHLRLTASLPAKDTTLTASPDAVRLWFSEQTDLGATKVDVKNAAGQPVGTAALTRGPQRDDPVVATFTAKPGTGRYTVDWRAMSKDGHVVKGSYGFTVKLAD